MDSLKADIKTTEIIFIEAFTYFYICKDITIKHVNKHQLKTTSKPVQKATILT